VIGGETESKNIQKYNEVEKQLSEKSSSGSLKKQITNYLETPQNPEM